MTRVLDVHLSSFQVHEVKSKEKLTLDGEIKVKHIHKEEILR
jgi:hypothetical protein